MSNTIDWGQGAVNNTIDWGKGKTNNTINWAEIYDSTPAGETNITGSGGVTPFVNTYSMEFDGIDEYANVGSTSLGITGAISVSAWVKIPVTNTGGASSPYIQMIVCEDNTSGGQRNWALSWRGTGYNYFSFQVWHTNLTNTSINSTGVVPNDGFWHHLLGTFDGTTGTNGMKFYIDGVLNGQTTATSTGINSFSTTETTMGALSGGTGRRLEGIIDEVAIWNSDQNTNAATIYNSGAPADLTSLSPLSWWRMGDGDTWGGSSWTLTDNGSGGNDATSVNMEEADRLPISPNSYSQNSFVFDGIDEYITLGNSSTFNITGDQSVSCWLKFTDSGLTRYAVNIKDIYGIYTNSGKIFGTSRISGAFKSVGSIANYNDGNWHHVLFVKNATNQLLYIDGSLENSTTDGGTSLGTTNDARLGARYTNTNFYEGSLDEVYIFDSDQSANISTIYGNGVPTDISSLNPLGHWRMGESATWNGSTWTLTDQGSGGNNATSVNMEEADKTGDQPYVI